MSLRVYADTVSSLETACQWIKCDVLQQPDRHQTEVVRRLGISHQKLNSYECNAHPNGSSIDGLCFVKNFGPCSVM